LALRRERLALEQREINAPDPDNLLKLAGDLTATGQQLDEAQAQLLELEDRLPGLEEERQAAHTAAREASQGLARLDARLAALIKLQEDVQKQGALQPWLEKHELGGLARLWKKLHIEAGWETALEAVLRERMAALE